MKLAISAETLFAFQRVTDIDTYILDLEQANANPSEVPNFTQHLYNTHQDLQTENTFPAGWDRLVRRCVARVT